MYYAFIIIIIYLLRLIIAYLYLLRIIISIAFIIIIIIIIIMETFINFKRYINYNDKPHFNR